MTAGKSYRLSPPFGMNAIEILMPNNERHKLSLRLDLANHSPTGFAWGYGGSGPAQSALAILADHLDNNARAMHLYQQFKWHVIAPLSGQKAHTITASRIDEWLAHCTT